MEEVSGAAGEAPRPAAVPDAEAAWLTMRARAGDEPVDTVRRAGRRVTMRSEAEELAAAEEDRTDAAPEATAAADAARCARRTDTGGRGGAAAAAAAPALDAWTSAREGKLPDPRLVSTEAPMPVIRPLEDAKSDQ